MSFSKSERFTPTFTTSTGLQGQIVGERRETSPQNSPRSEDGWPTETLRKDTFANFAAPQGPIGAPRKSSNMDSSQEQQIRNIFNIARRQAGQQPGVTIPIPGTPEGSPRNSPPPSPRETHVVGEIGK